MEANGEKVLQAIQRGITTRPRLRDSTGFTYAELELILHNLEFEDQVINHTETADGFPRYSARLEGTMGYITEADHRSAAKKGVSLSPNGDKLKAALCGCGRSSNHNGRCTFRRAKAHGDFSRSVSEVISDAEECLNGAEAVSGPVIPRVTEALTALDAKIDRQSEQEDLAAIERVSPQIVSPRGRGLHFPPSALLKKIVMDDDFFPGAYETLVAILDVDMSAEEKQAVWTLLQYLKRVEKTHQEACIVAEMAS